MSKKKVVEPAELVWGDGNVVRKPRSPYLYYDFRHLGIRVETSSGYPDTPENRTKVVAELMDKRKQMGLGTIRFSDAFPNASPKLKALFAAKEALLIAPSPQEVKIGAYITFWTQDVLAYIEPKNKRYALKIIIDYWVLPAFSNFSFFEVDTSLIGKFISTMRQKKGKNNGKRLSKARIRRIIFTLRLIWSDACEKYRWELPDPFKNVRKQMPKDDEHDEFLDDTGGIPSVAVSPQVPLRFNDFLSYLRHMDPWYQPMAELWILTGLIPSEMAGLTPRHIRDGYLYIRSFVSNGVKNNKGKTKFRQRAIRITSSIRRILDVFLSRPRDSDDDPLISRKSGKPLTHAAFNAAWRTAEALTELPHHRVPYVLRHSFAAWALTIGVDMNRLVGLMGHASKAMVFEVYGEYVEGLEEDRYKILEYFGHDFIAPSPSTGGLQDTG